MRTAGLPWGAAAVLALCAGAAQAAGVGEIIAQMPKKSAADGQRLTAQLARAGASAVLELCGMLKAPGKGKNEKARYALHGLALYVTRPGAEAERAMMEGALIRALAARSDPEIRAFIIRQIQLAGKDRSVAPLAKLLTDGRLGEPAAQALLRVRAEGVGAAFARALPRVRGAARVTIIRALGELRHTAAAKSILPHAKSADRPTRHAAWFALANMGDRRGLKLLLGAAQSKDARERRVGTRFALLAAERIGEQGDVRFVSGVCASLFRSALKAGDARTTSAALSVLAHLPQKKADAYPHLWEAVAKGGLEIREAALMLAQRMPGEAVTRKWMDAAAWAKPVLYAAIIAMLGRRGDAAALPAVIQAQKDADAGVRKAAIKAIGQFHSAQAAGVLVKALAGGDAQVAAAAKAALSRVPGKAVADAVAKELNGAPAKTLVMLLGLLGMRQAEEHADAVFALTSHADGSVRLAALKAMAHVGTAEDLSRLAARMLKVKSSTEQREAQTSVVALAKKIPDPNRRGAALGKMYAGATTDERVLILRTLSRIGGSAGLDAVVAATGSSNEKIRDAGVRALADWRGPAAADLQLKLARGTDNLKHHVLTLRGLAVLIAASDMPQPRKVSLLQDAFKIAKRPDEKRLLLGTLGRIKRTDALKLAAELLDDAAVRQAAIQAAVSIALPVRRGQRGLRGPEVRTILERILTLTKDNNIKRRVQQHLRSMPKR